MLYCRDCGKENPDDAKYCCNCGTLLTLQPTQGTGLRSLPEIKPDNVEEIEDVPDLTEINAFPKEEIKLELIPLFSTRSAWRRPLFSIISFSLSLNTPIIFSPILGVF